jgi:hypothetical protein
MNSVNSHVLLFKIAMHPCIVFTLCDLYLQDKMTIMRYTMTLIELFTTIQYLNN